jgi:hypothetical protein
MSVPAPPRVDTRAAAQRVVPVAREQGIFASSSVQGVVAGASKKVVVASAPFEGIVAGPAVEPVVRLELRKYVVAGRAAEIIRVPSSGQRVMVVASGTATGRVLQAR